MMVIFSKANMQSEVLPAELHLVPPPTLPQARSYMFKQKSDLQEYDVQRGNRIRINLPRLQSSYLMKDSYLRFRLNIDCTASSTNTGLWFDRCGAHGLFERIEVYDYLGGTLIEQVNNIPALVTLLGDLNYDYMDFNGKLEALQGYEGANVTASIIKTEEFQVRSANGGMRLVSKGTATTGNKQFVTYEFAIPVFCFLGIFSDKYIPLHNGFSIDFFLNNKDYAFVSRLDEEDGWVNSETSKMVLNEVWLSDVEYCCQVMELGDQAEQMVSTGSEPFVIPSIQYRHFSDIVLGGGTASSFRTDLNLNVVSLRNIRFTMRPTYYQALNYPTYGHRIRNFLYNWNFQYGSSYLPEIAGISSRAITLPRSRSGATTIGYTVTPAAFNEDWLKARSYNQCYAELAKTIDVAKNITISTTEYEIDLGINTTGSNFVSFPLEDGNCLVPYTSNSKTASGKFAAGLDTRLSRKQAVSGLDTNGLLVSLNGQFDSIHVTEMTQSVLDIWAEYDAFVQVIPGVATTVTF